MKCPGKIWLVDKYTQICIFLLYLLQHLISLSLKNIFKWKCALIDDKNHRISRNSKIIYHKVTSVIGIWAEFFRASSRWKRWRCQHTATVDLRTGPVPFVDQNTMSASTRIYMDEDEDLSCHAVWSVLHSFPNLHNNFIFVLWGDKLVLNTAKEVSQIKQMSAYTQFFLFLKNFSESNIGIVLFTRVSEVRNN